MLICVENIGGQIGIAVKSMPSRRKGWVSDERLGLWRGRVGGEGLWHVNYEEQIMPRGQGRGEGGVVVESTSPSFKCEWTSPHPTPAHPTPPHPTPHHPTPHHPTPPQPVGLCSCWHHYILQDSSSQRCDTSCIDDKNKDCNLIIATHAHTQTSVFFHVLITSREAKDTILYTKHTSKSRYCTS